MAREINPVCNFIFGSIHTCLLTDTVDIELTIRIVKAYTLAAKITLQNPLSSLLGAKV